MRLRFEKFGLRAASDLFERGWRVFLFVNAKGIQEKTQDESTATHPVPDHYVALASKVTFTPALNTKGIVNFADDSISFLCVSWGRQIPVADVMAANWCGNYYGYLAAIN